MDSRKFASLLALFLILSLATVGVAYGLWSETLHIEGEVETGDVSVIWTKAICADKETLKDVGSVSGEIDSADPGHLYFHIENGYPGYEGDCEVEYTSTGSIPVHVEAINFIPWAGLTDCTILQSPRTGSIIAQCNELTVTWANGLCTQLHQGDFLASSIYTEVQQDAAQNSQYEFSIEIQLNQFNESGCP